VCIAVDETVRATRPGGDRKVGVVWHTQGSGKSLTMAYAPPSRPRRRSCASASRSGTSAARPLRCIPSGSPSARALTVPCRS
jgi:hypothetical protein